MEKSESIIKLSAALVKFAGLMTTVKKDSTNPHFRNKYASLSAIIEGTQKQLSDCGLAVVQLPAGENQLTTMLVHETGEFISETYTMRPSKQDPQGIGSAITYQRRYALGAILNLNIDEDDDGNQASAPAKQTTQEKPKEKPELVESSKAYHGVVQWIKAGGTDEEREKLFQSVYNKYTVSEAVKQSVLTAAKAQRTKDEPAISN